MLFTPLSLDSSGDFTSWEACREVEERKKEKFKGIPPKKVCGIAQKIELLIVLEFLVFSTNALSPSSFKFSFTIYHFDSLI